MRRSVKVAALASAAALLAIGASMTSFAKGWTQEDGEWVWLDSDGERVTEEFKLSGSKYYWLNEDGVLGSDELVEYKEHKYYVDETGAMVTNQWREVENDDDDDFGDTVWYYLQSSGKAYENGKKSINGTYYIFNEDGKMMYGWIKEDTESNPKTYTMASDEDDSDDWKESQYYAGDASDGAVVTSAWRQIRVYDPSPAQTTVDTGDNDYWFYFGSNGKKYGYEADEKKREPEEYKDKKVNGVYYAFSQADGHMLSEWAPATDEEATTSIDSVKYYSDPESGARLTKGWFKVAPSVNVNKDDSKDYDNEEYWFYAKSKGKLEANGIKSINGKKYLFDEDGQLLAGLYYLELEEDGKTLANTNYKKLDDEDKIDDYTLDLLGKGSESGVDEDVKYAGVFYFATPIDTDAAMKTGTCNVTVDGETYAFKFATNGVKGMGANGPSGNYYYVNGRKVKADSDQKYQLYEANVNTSTKKVETLNSTGMNASYVKLNYEFGEDGSYDDDRQLAVISSTGTIVKSGTKKDSDGYKITVTNGVVTKIVLAD